MTPEIQVMTQATVDFLSWFVMPFIVFIIFGWLASLFHNGL